MNMNAMFDAMQSTLGAHIPQLLGAFLILWSAGMSQTPSGPVYVGSWGWQVSTSACPTLQVKRWISSLPCLLPLFGLS